MTSGTPLFYSTSKFTFHRIDNSSVSRRSWELWRLSYLGFAQAKILDCERKCRSSQSLGKCILRKRHNALVGKQLMADVPDCRLQFDRPGFYKAGCDFFGPLIVRQGRAKVKRYGCVFTCLTMRAIHIEIAHTLDTDSFINALRRFIARRGKPHEMFTDNESNFVGAERVLRTALQTFNVDKIHRHCSLVLCYCFRYLLML